MPRRGTHANEYTDPNDVESWRAVMRLTIAEEWSNETRPSDQNVENWRGIARDAGVPMSQLRAVAVIAKAPGHVTESVLDARLDRRILLAHRLLEQLDNASVAQVRGYWMEADGVAPRVGTRARRSDRV